MDLERWNPWKELERARREADGLLEAALEKLRGEGSSRELAFVPAIDIVETREAFHVYLSVPGVLEEDIDIAVSDGDEIVVRGERETPVVSQGATFRLRQWKYGCFESRIALPGAVDAEAIDAILENGVLAITVPRATSDGEDARRDVF